MTAPTELPFATASLPGIGGRLRAAPDDFRVEEVPAYLPAGDGEHIYIRFEKRDLTTPQAVERIARALGADPRDCGYAGLKDRHAVTTQWASFPRVDPERAKALALDNVRVLEVGRHRNKLRTGHLHGNRFVLRVIEIADVPLALARASGIATELQMKGCPNYFGEQRFGREGDNAARGAAWMRGEAPAPREPFLRKLWVSAVQSELFNRYLAARVADGLLGLYVPGDLAARHPGGRPWSVDPAEAQGLYDSREVSATGPLFGASMPQAAGEALAREESVLAASGLTAAHFEKVKAAGEGARRLVRLFPEGFSVEQDGDALRCAFTLPAGAYATVIMRELQKTSVDVETDPRPVASLSANPPTN
ncbi:MAG: tRNA pseudouridine(13) synthase TruD [Polyangiales bacterium]